MQVIKLGLVEFDLNWWAAVQIHEDQVTIAQIGRNDNANKGRVKQNLCVWTQPKHVQVPETEISRDIYWFKCHNEPLGQK